MFMLIPAGISTFREFPKGRNDRNPWRILWDGDREGYTPIFAELDQQFIHVVLGKVFSTPFLVIGGLARNDGEKASSLDWP
jgi:hypothetical protein